MTTNRLSLENGIDLTPTLSYDSPRDPSDEPYRLFSRLGSQSTTLAAFISNYNKADPKGKKQLLKVAFENYDEESIFRILNESNLFNLAERVNAITTAAFYALKTVVDQLLADPSILEEWNGKSQEDRIRDFMYASTETSLSIFDRFLEASQTCKDSQGFFDRLALRIIPRISSNLMLKRMFHYRSLSRPFQLMALCKAVEENNASSVAEIFQKHREQLDVVTLRTARNMAKKKGYRDITGLLNTHLPSCCAIQ